MEIPAPPSKTRAELIVDERAAEFRVREAESAVMFARASDDPEQIARAEAALEATRTESLAVRRAMEDGFAALTRYAAYQEAVAHAELHGIPLPESTPAVAPDVTPQG